MKKLLLPVLICSIGSVCAQVSKSTNDLSFLLGQWKTKMVYSPETETSRTQNGAFECGYVLDDKFIKCSYKFERPGKVAALNDVYFNYNALAEKYESLWFSSTWPVKVLLSGDVQEKSDSIFLETFAEFPIEDGLTEYVRDVLIMKKGTDSFSRKTYIRTSNDTDWKYHSLEKANRTSVEALANSYQISGKTWRALGPAFNTTVRETSQIYISDRLAAEYQLDKSLVQNFLKYTLSYTRDQLSADKVLYRYPHYNRVAVEEDLQTLADKGLVAQSDTVLTTTQLGNQILAGYWDLRQQQVSYYDYVSDDRLQTLYRVMNKIVTRARNLDPSYSNESIQARFLSRPATFEDAHLAIKISELLKEYTAFINDVSHYKYVQFPPQSADTRWQGLALSPLANELMSATRNGRVYELSSCYQQSNWKQGQSGCDAAVDELIAAGLITKENGSIRQTSTGAELSKAAEAFADKRRYAAWQDVTISEYLEFVEILDWILDNPVESFVPYPERHRRLIQSIGFSPNEDTLYFSLPHREYRENEGVTVTLDTPRLAIYYATQTATGWGEPQLIDFGAKHKVYEPTLSPDGQLMIFNSNRQLDDSPVEDRGPNNLWYSEKKNGIWQEPKYLVNVNSKALGESYATITADGELFYVQESRVDGEMVVTIVSTQFEGENTRKGTPIGLGNAIADPWVAPDGSYIIYTKFDPDDWVNTCDLHYSFRDGDGWTAPKRMPEINGKRSDYAVAITPDEQWFYYRRRGRFLKFPFQPLLEQMKAE